MTRSKETHYTKYLTREEFRLLLREVKKRNSKPFEMCFKFMTYLALRISDAVSLKVENLDKNCSELNYTEQKTKKHRSVKIPFFFQKEIKEYVKEYKHLFIDNYLFPALYNTPKRDKVRNEHLSPATFRHFFKDFRRKYGFDKPYYKRKDGRPLYRISPHTLKHFSIYCFWEASNHDLGCTQQFSNHTETKHVIRYLMSLENINKQAKIIQKAFAEI